MTLEEAIEMYTSNAEHERTHGSLQGCMDFKQLAEWLKELKAYKEQGEDYISRQAAIDAIYARYIGGKEAVDKAPASDHYAEGIDEAVCAVEDLPPVTPQPKMGRWIPVSERLPGDGKYLVTRGDVIGRPMIGMRYFSKDLSKVDEYEFESKKGVSGWCEYDSEYGWYIDDKVTAWMPLPEPYKAESEEKE